MSKLEKNIRRIKIIQMLGNAGICEEYNGIVKEPCPMYSIDCPRLCTYAKSMKKKVKSSLIERIDDGEVLKENEDGTYSFKRSMMDKPFKYTYKMLIEDKKYKGKFREIPNES